MAIFYDSQKILGTRGALHHWKNSYKTDLPPRGFVWIVHGMGEHAGRYDEFATYLNQAGFDVVAPDLPGHGLSAAEGGQKRLATVGEMVESLVEGREYFVSRGPLAAKGLVHTPWYLLGHSMGAMLALLWIVRGRRPGENDAHEFARRAFISAPPLDLRIKLPAWKQAASSFLNTRAPDLRIPNGLSADMLSYDAANVAAYREDPMVHGDSSPGQFNSMLAAQKQLFAAAGDVEIPVHLAVGADDPIVDPDAVKRYYEALRTHKKFTQIPHAKHEILNELSRRTTYADAAGWFL